ncbi:MAG TPA: BatA domain-containing protein [Sedimentisphaerales bacterium]|nr:BatA domain-containing protein [Sedimentisphaerales bacterium]
MSFLYPLFLAGIAAVGLPIVLHMIRRHTRKRITFSSLMFLRTTIPRFKNRSRIENLLLLILRCIILCLLAFGFSRPFFPREAVESRVRLGRRIVLLIDTSASMRRAGMWDQAISEAKSVLEGVSQADRVCVISFDQSTKTQMGFEQWGALVPSQRASIVIEHISELSPGWAPTNLGNALVSAAESIEDDEINEGQQTLAMRQVVLISDLQEGSNLEAMHAYEWPEEMELVVKPVRCQGTTNAALQLVTDRSGLGGSADDSSLGIRITNSSDATAERFQLNWADETAASASSRAVDVYVPPGHSIVMRAPDRADGSEARKLILTGDDHDFDNTLYLAPHLQQQVNVLYIGSDDPNDSRGMLYYARRAFGATGALKPIVISRPGNKTIAAIDIETAHLIITADVVNRENLVSLRRYLESGRTLLLVMKSIDDAKTLAGLAGIETIESQEADVDRYAMLGRIEFKHPLLGPFSDPRFGDFTQIHFWKYRRINIGDPPSQSGIVASAVSALPDARVLARFDNGDPAWIELPVGKGSLLVMTFGWHPSDSQLALSSKFVPLLYSILEYGGVLAGQQSQYFVGDHIPIPHSKKAESANLQIRKPDNSLISLDAGQQVFTQTDLPGIYTIESPTGNPPSRSDIAASTESAKLFAVNLPAKECQTAAMPIEDLERFGVLFKQTSASSVEPSSSVALERTSQARHHSSFAELEYEQKVWRWVFIALLAVSLIEIWLAGWLTRPPSNLQGEEK